jgi:hypothetical protein
MRVEDRTVEELKREQEIFDQGYAAVRTMAKEMVANRATLADVLFHADQLWHEFKVGALGIPETGALVRSGMYLDCCDRAFTNNIIRSYSRYAGGTDEVRVAMYAAAYGREATGDDLVAD